MKVIATNIFLGSDLGDKLKKLGYTGTHNQFRIICKCKSMADANRKLHALIGREQVFKSGWTSETGNKRELTLCETADVWIEYRDSNLDIAFISLQELIDLKH